jgi:uncharacterized protein
MILIDAKLLLYAYDDHSARHAPAARWLEKTLSGAELAGFSWTVLLAFLRLSTDPRVFRRPLTISQAIEVIASWLAHPRFTLLQPRDITGRSFSTS